MTLLAMFACTESPQTCGEDGPWPCILPTTVVDAAGEHRSEPPTDGGNCAPNVWVASSDNGLESVQLLLDVLLGDVPPITESLVDWSESVAVVAALACGGGLPAGYEIGDLIATGTSSATLEVRVAGSATTDAGPYYGWTLIETPRRALTFLDVSMVIEE